MLQKVEDAIDQVQAAHPEAFSGDQIKDLSLFRWGVTQNLQAAGYCVEWDSDQIGVKYTNDFSEHFHIDTSSGLIQRGWNSYRSTCEPALFPIDAKPLPPVPGCSLPASATVGCGPIGAPGAPFYAGVMDQIYADIAKDRPDLVGPDGKVLIYDPKDHTGDNRPIFVAYNAEVAKRIQAKGYCAFIDETLVNLKNDNDISEFYAPVHEGFAFPERRNDVDPKTGYTQSAAAGYAGTCRPAAF
jgi:hypothetical protein